MKRHRRYVVWDCRDGQKQLMGMVEGDRSEIGRTLGRGIQLQPWNKAGAGVRRRAARMTP